jgi:DNA-binding NtrC family response regulator
LVSATDSKLGTICLLTPNLINSNHAGHITVNINEKGEVFQAVCDTYCDVCRVLNESGGGGYFTIDAIAKMCCVDISSVQGNLITPIQYQRKPIGILVLTPVRPQPVLELHAEASQMLTRELAYHFKRYELSQLAKQKMGKDLMFIGASEPMRSIDHFIEKASRVNLPVLITGEEGCKKRDIAYAIHLASNRHEASFVQVNCSTLNWQNHIEEISDLFAKAQGGTILFNYVDELPVKLQSSLLDLLGLGTGQLLGNAESKYLSDVRIIATASKNLEEFVKEKQFCYSLLQDLNFIHTGVAPLRERKEDIEHIIHYFLRKYGGEERYRLSDDVLTLCKNYDWHQNDKELERIIARLAIMVDGEVITIDDLRLFAPALVKQSKDLTNVEGSINLPDSSLMDQDNSSLQRRKADVKVVQMASLLSKGEVVEIGNLHTSMQKVLDYIGTHFHEKISLTQIARHACISPSHLSYLFQKSLGISFKTFLSIVRIEKAKQLLVEKPFLRVTEISAEVGYEELSHFERTFKRFIQCTPREFRQKFQGDSKLNR